MCSCYNDRYHPRVEWELMQKKSVVTSFLIQESPEGDRILLLRRSNRVKTHKGRWAGVSGYLEDGVTPEDQARTELREETNLGSADVQLLARGEPVYSPDPPTDTEWVVHPFLFRLNDPEQIRLDWEHVETAWIAPEEIIDYPTVPNIRDTFDAVYPLEVLLLAKGHELAQDIARIKGDNILGATELAREAAHLLHRVAKTTNDVEVLERACLLVARARPAMAPVCNIALTVLGSARGAMTRDPLAAAARSAWRMAAILEVSPKAIAKFGRVYLKGVLVTISSSSSVRGALIENRDQISRVIVAEGRPLMEGRLLAKSLATEGIPVELITEAQIPLAVQHADAAIIGGDAFLGDGSVVNKVGSRLLALAARDRGIPFYVLADAMKLAPWTPENPPKGAWEEGEAADVWPDAGNGVSVRSATFETVPSHLITKYVTDEGIREAAQVAALARSADKLWAQLETGPK